MLKKLLLGAALAFTSTAAFADADGQNRAVRVINYSNSHYIVSLTAVNEHGRSYDALPQTQHYISPGYNRILTFDDNEGHNHCNFVVRATFDNGVAAERTLNVCSATNWNIYDIDNTVD